MSSPSASASQAIPFGFRAAGVCCGLKRTPGALDLALLVSDVPAVAAGLYTQNLFCAAPVALDQQRTPSDQIRAIVINSGNANACTGERGLRDAIDMTRQVARACQLSDNQVLVLSTGIIGEHLDMRRIESGIDQAAGMLSARPEGLLAAAEAMMTTDTRPKMSYKAVPCGPHGVRIAGLAKGAGMIKPDMATMLAVILTDARIAPRMAQELLAQAVAETFNRISIDGHTSTNDSVILLANGMCGGGEVAGDGNERFREALGELCSELACAIAGDGEGATKLIEVIVCGCARPEDARAIADAIIRSPLVKTAFAGNDPNWGRIISAAGCAGPRFDTSRVRLAINGTTVFDRGEPTRFDADLVSRSMQERTNEVRLDLGEGSESDRAWTCDLTAEYVRINAHYRT
jgi:glutamate N-acetyltransferase/amino-acid N-acetyltransferase